MWEKFSRLGPLYSTKVSNFAIQYNLSCASLALAIMRERVGAISPAVEVELLAAVFIGNVVGMFLFGYLGDVLGVPRATVWTCTVSFVGAVLGSVGTIVPITIWGGGFWGGHVVGAGAGVVGEGKIGLGASMGGSMGASMEGSVVKGGISNTISPVGSGTSSVSTPLPGTPGTISGISGTPGTIAGMEPGNVVEDSAHALVLQWFAFSRFLLGVGVGGLYPLSAKAAANDSSGSGGGGGSSSGTSISGGGSTDLSLSDASTQALSSPSRSSGNGSISTATSVLGKASLPPRGADSEGKSIEMVYLSDERVEKSIPNVNDASGYTISHSQSRSYSDDMEDMDAIIMAKSAKVGEKFFWQLPGNVAPYPVGLLLLSIFPTPTGDSTETGSSMLRLYAEIQWRLLVGLGCFPLLAVLVWNLQKMGDELICRKGTNKFGPSVSSITSEEGLDEESDPYESEPLNKLNKSSPPSSHVLVQGRSPHGKQDHQRLSTRQRASGSTATTSSTADTASTEASLSPRGDSQGPNTSSSISISMGGQGGGSMLQQSGSDSVPREWSGETHTKGKTNATIAGDTISSWFRDPDTVKTLIGTGGTWFLFDVAYYGTNLATPVIIKKIFTHGSLESTCYKSMITACFQIPACLFGIRYLRTGLGSVKQLNRDGFIAMMFAFGLMSWLVYNPDVSGVLGASGGGETPNSTKSDISESTKAPGESDTNTYFTPAMFNYLILNCLYFTMTFGCTLATYILPTVVFQKQIQSTMHGISAGLGKAGAAVGMLVVPLGNVIAGGDGGNALTVVFLIQSAVCGVGWWCNEAFIPWPPGGQNGGGIRGTSRDLSGESGGGTIQHEGAKE